MSGSGLVEIISFCPGSSTIFSFGAVSSSFLRILIPCGMVYLPIVVSKYQPVMFIFSPSVSFGVRVNEEEREFAGGAMREIFIFPKYGEILDTGSCLKAGDGVNNGACFI